MGGERDRASDEPVKWEEERGCQDKKLYILRIIKYFVAEGFQRAIGKPFGGAMGFNSLN